MLTKKDFEALAHIIHKYGVGYWDMSMIKDLCDFCRERNSLFNEQKFVEACGLEYDKYLEGRYAKS